MEGDHSLGPLGTGFGTGPGELVTGPRVPETCPGVPAPLSAGANSPLWRPVKTAGQLVKQSAGELDLAPEVSIQDGDWKKTLPGTDFLMRVLGF